MQDVSAPTWTDVRERVTATLRALPDTGFLVLGEPEAPLVRAGGLRGLLGGRVPAAPTRFVQALRISDVLLLECVGPQSAGGPYPVDPATHERLRAAGWPAPGDPGHDPQGGPHYRTVHPVTDAEQAAALLVGALAMLGLTPSGPLQLHTGP